MPPAAHRLSLLLLPADLDAPGDTVTAALAALRDEGFIAADGAPGARALVSGGFGVARAEVFDGLRFASNGQGGFAVRCPVDGANLVGAFNRALPAWRAGGPRTVACPCGRIHDLAALHYLPDAGFARGWLVLSDVCGLDLTPEGRSAVTTRLPGVRIVVRRG